MKFRDLGVGDVFLRNNNAICYKSVDNTAIDQHYKNYRVSIDEDVEPVLLADGSILKDNQTLYFYDCDVVKSFKPHHVIDKGKHFTLFGHCGNGTAYVGATSCHPSIASVEISRIKYILHVNSGSQLDIFGDITVGNDKVNIFSLKERLALLEREL